MNLKSVESRMQHIHVVNSEHTSGKNKLKSLSLFSF